MRRRLGKLGSGIGIYFGARRAVMASVTLAVMVGSSEGQAQGTPVKADVGTAGSGVVSATPPVGSATPPVQNQLDELERENLKLQTRLAKSEAETATAKEVHATAERTAAEARAQEKEGALALAKAGKLMSSGVTAGVALAVHTGLGSSSGQIAVDSSAMPYVMIHFGYIGADEPVRLYCSSAWAFGGHGSEATAAAVGASRKWAEPIVASIEAELKLGMTPAEVLEGRRGEAWLQNDPRKLDVLLRVMEKLHEAISSGDTAARAAAITSIARFKWDAAYRAKGCAIRGLGLWIGKPLGYTTATKVSESNRAERDLKPIIATGLGWTPHAYFTLLAGVSVSNMGGEEGDSVTRERTVASFTFGVGGNLDLVGDLFK